MSWPVRYRRLFLLGLPIMALLWLVAMATLLAAEIVLSMLQPLESFWSAPAVILRRREHYGYRPSAEKPGGARRRLAVKNAGSGDPTVAARRHSA